MNLHRAWRCVRALGLSSVIKRLVYGHQRLKVIEEARLVQARDIEVRLAKLSLR